MIIKLFVLFVVVPLFELALIIWIGQYLGIIPTILLILVTAALGATMAKIQGTLVWLRLMRELRSGQLPGDTIIEGALIFAGGITFLTPGFITDFLGLLCLIPPTRRIFRDWIKQWLQRKINQGKVIWFSSDPEL